MDENECIVCFSIYDDKERRPRFMPCGHTLCSSCLEKAISDNSKMCPKCRRKYQASSMNDLPVNFSLMGLVTSERLPECPEHQLPLSHRCTTHKAWICQSCLTEDHSPGSCNIITLREELSIKKSAQLDLAQQLLNKFEEKCKKSDDSKHPYLKLIEESEYDILRLEAIVNDLQAEIHRKRTFKAQMENNYSMFEYKLSIIRGKRSSYDAVVRSLKSSETLKEVSRCSVEVQKEAKKLQLIACEIEKEEELMLRSSDVTAQTRLGLSLGNHKLSVIDGRHHLHVIQEKSNFLTSHKSIQ
ncbi:unnamed protein product, partial [Meganyctiphanes norvegica]